MSWRPPHFQQLGTANWWPNPPITPPFHLAPAPNQVGAPVPPRHPQASPPSAALHFSPPPPPPGVPAAPEQPPCLQAPPDPALQFSPPPPPPGVRAAPEIPPPSAAFWDPVSQFPPPPPRPGVPAASELPPGSQVSADLWYACPQQQQQQPLPDLWYAWSQQQQQQQQQQPPPDLWYAWSQQQQQQPLPDLWYAWSQQQQQQQQPPQQNYGLQGSYFHQSQGSSTMPGAPPQPSQQNYVHSTQGYNPMSQYETWAPPPPLQQHWGSPSSSLREPQVARASTWPSLQPSSSSSEPQGASGSTWPSQQPLHGKRHLEDGEYLYPKRIKKVTMQVVYIPVLDFLNKHPPIEPYEFKVGCTVGSIPIAETVKTTKAGVCVLDGYVELFEDMHAKDKSYGGDFDVTDMLVSEEAPFAVTINKKPKLKASRSNSDKDLNKLVSCLVIPRYGESGKRPAYVDDFIHRVKRLPKLKPNRRKKLLWIIRHHPLFIESAKRRLVLEDFYKFYKMLGDNYFRDRLFEEIYRIKRYKRWHLLIAPKDKFISSVYWKGREHQCPMDHYEKEYSRTIGPNDENPVVFPFTSPDGYLAVLLRHFIVHGPHDAKLLEVELEELDLIIAYYFGEFLPIFLDEISSIEDRFEMIKEMLTTYADRRSVARRAPG